MGVRWRRRTRALTLSGTVTSITTGASHLATDVCNRIASKFDTIQHDASLDSSHCIAHSHRDTQHKMPR